MDHRLEVSPGDVAPDRVRPLLRAEYDRLVELGAFEDERLELLRGQLVTMGPQKGPHASTVSRLTDWLVPALAGRAQVRVQLPLAISEDSEPEPDLALVPLGDYDDAHPEVALLVIEVSDSSLGKDLGLKLRIYADAAVPEYWVVNLDRRWIQIHLDPADGGYRTVRTVPGTEELAPRAFLDVAITVDRLLPRPR